MADEDDIVRVDLIVVGGGPAGIAAALTAAREGLEVILIERGAVAGSKNMGGLVYGTILTQLIPEAWEKAPIERSVARRGVTYLGAGQHMGMEFGADAWSEPPYNHTYVVNRSQFDRWFAAQAEEAGANLLEGMVVDDLLYEGEGADKKVVGVQLRGDERFYASAVILAEGANCLVTDKARVALAMPGGRHQQDFAIGVKEMISLPRDVLESRFRLEGKQGVAFDYMGVPFEGLIGGGFLYTSAESVHVGVVAKIETLVKSRKRPSDILDAFKNHPAIRPYLVGGEVVEYAAHMLPEGGYAAIGSLTANGLMITGDAAGLLNMSLYKEGTNHAMESGMLAAKAVIAAKQGGDFSKAGLALYEQELQTVVMQDLKKVQDLPAIMEETPELFSTYPEKINRLLVEYFTVTHQPKSRIQKDAVKRFRQGLRPLRFLRHLFRARKLI